MTISIVDHEIPYYTHDIYDVKFYNDRIRTLVTHTADMVETWISRMEDRLDRNSIVGLDVEWRPNNRFYTNPVATLQLCVNHSCLIFQILHADSIPQALDDFLANGRYTFVGAGIRNDAEKLLDDYNLTVTNTVELGPLAARVMGRGELWNAGLKGLCRHVLGMELEKPNMVARSRWDKRWLTYSQIQYACVDAFISSEIARYLYE